MRVGNRRVSRLAALGVVVCVAAAAGDVALVTVGHAAQDDTQSVNFSIYNGRVAVAADREQVGTEVDVGFDGGAVNNFYPLARIDVATAGTNAAASPADTGPLAQAVFAGQNVTQPQYVFAQYPGATNPPSKTFGTANAAASVTEASANAAASYAAVGETPSSALAGQSDGSDGGTALATGYFDSTLGFVTVGDSRVHHASYGAGALVLDDVHVVARVSSKGSAVFSKDVSVTVGAATVTLNGTTIPVTIDQNGVTVAQTNAPLDVVQTVSAQLNAALAGQGISVHAVSPQVTQQGDNLHVEAEGVVVSVQQRGTPDGVPKQYVRHTLGEVVLDSEAVTAPPQPDLSLDTGATDLGSFDSGSTSTVVTNPVPVVAPPPVPAPAATPAPAAKKPQALVPVSAEFTTQSRPRWLLFGYLAWQALMLALVGALYLHRSALRRLP